MSQSTTPASLPSLPGVRAVLDAAPDGVLVVDDDGIVGWPTDKPS